MPATSEFWLTVEHAAAICAILGLPGLLAILVYVIGLYRMHQDFPLHRHVPADGAGCTITYPKGFYPETGRS